MSMSHPGDQVPAGGEDARPGPGFAFLLSLAMAQFMVVLDFTIVNVALPSIQGELHVATTTLQCWSAPTRSRSAGFCRWAGG